MREESVTHGQIITVCNLWQQLGLNILYKPKMADRYYPLVIAKDYLSGWAVPLLVKRSISEKVEDIV